MDIKILAQSTAFKFLEYVKLGAWPNTDMAALRITSHLAILSPSNIIKEVSGLESFPMKRKGNSSFMGQLPP